MDKIARLVLVFFCASAIQTGCATQSTTKTVKKETVHYPAETAENTARPVLVESETIESSKSEGESPGVLSDTVHVVGHVLAMPFRFVGGLIGLVF